jgi:hypothetical protein
MLLRRSGSGFLAYGSSYSLHLPSRTTSGLSQVSSPFTVAGQRRTCTGFPVLQGVKMNTDTLTWAMLRRLQNPAGIAAIAPDGLRVPSRRVHHTPPARRHYNSVAPICNTVFSTCAHLVVRQGEVDRQTVTVSFPRQRESKVHQQGFWMPASAGMTTGDTSPSV